MAGRTCCPTIASTGFLSNFASYRPFRRWIAPGPCVAMQQPNPPVYLAWPVAMKAADSSCLACTNVRARDSVGEQRR